jgi:hypothetical protein
MYDSGAGVYRQPARATHFRGRACEYAYAPACEKPKEAAS